MRFYFNLSRHDVFKYALEDAVSLQVEPVNYPAKDGVGALRVSEMRYALPFPGLSLPNELTEEQRVELAKHVVAYGTLLSEEKQKEGFPLHAFDHTFSAELAAMIYVNPGNKLNFTSRICCLKELRLLLDNKIAEAAAAAQKEGSST